MSNALLIQANLREKLGTGPARSLRNTGYVPAVLYGNGVKTRAIAISEKDAIALHHDSQIKTSIINMKIGDENHNVFTKQFTLHPVTGSVEHIDFMFVGDKAGELRMSIPIKIKGREKCVGIKKGGVVNMVFRTLPCIVAKDKLPPFIEIDVSSMDVGVTLRLKDITLPDGVAIAIKDLNQTFLRLTGKKKVVEKAGLEETEEGADSTEGNGKESNNKEASPAGDEKKG